MQAGVTLPATYNFEIYQERNRPVMYKMRTIRFFVCMLTLFMLVGCASSKKENESTAAATEASVVQTETIIAFTEPNGAVVVGESDEEGLTLEDSRPTEEETAPTEENQETTKSTENTKPDATEPDATEPGATEPTATSPTQTTEPESNEPQGPCCEYAQYLAMDPAQQQEYMMSFENVGSFINWVQQAEAAHNAHSGDDVVGDGDISIGDYMN